MRPAYRFTVSGRVQGVYFRQSTLQHAQRLGLCGWVRNLPDGRVQGLACGDEAALSSLREWLHEGPPAARVESVDWVSAEDEGAVEFSVLR